ncbi:hypothetical protein AAG570_002648 [Ranatra chinensis]|uniref:C2H2-type domain-containing protein n=1 Tax=Ranatra chinensis TaxID=642074 RepID=A0ABD0Y8K6_9HEMI
MFYSLEKSSGSNSFECPHCLRRFGRRSRLTSHIAVAHSSDRPLACAMCDAAFPSLDKLARHARTHTGEKPFACAQCPKAFADKRNLENHVRTHTGERPYACAVCSKAFAVRSHATDHARRVHHRTPEYFQCEHCSKRYRWKNKYRRHLKTSHPDRVATAESSK